MSFHTFITLLGGLEYSLITPTVPDVTCHLSHISHTLPFTSSFTPMDAFATFMIGLLLFLIVALLTVQFLERCHLERLIRLQRQDFSHTVTRIIFARSQYCLGCRIRSFLTSKKSPEYCI
jgi:hypothetical protein